MEFVRKIFNYIKMFFDKDKLVEDIKKEELKNNEINENVHESEVLDKFQEQIEEFGKYKDLKFGDVIFVKRYKNEEEKQRIPIGHREGPAIVISNSDDKLLCVFGSGVEPDFNYGGNSVYELLGGNYNLIKKTYFSMGKLRSLTYDRIEESFGQLKGNDLELLKKKYIMMRNRGCYKNTDSLDFDISLKVGDILRNYDYNYLILKVNKDDYSCFVLHEVENNEPNTILIDNKYYKINFKNPKKISKDKEAILISALEGNQLISILKRYNDYLDNKINQKIAQRGSLIKYDDKLYFIYGENKDKWLTFRLFSQYSTNLMNVKINYKNYYTSFSKLREINKSDEFEVLCLATKQELEYISNKKKEINKQNKVVNQKKVNKNNQNIKFDFPNFLPGEIVKTKTMCDDKYIVVSRYAKFVYCISLDNIKNGSNKVEYFDIKLLVKLGKISDEYYNIVDQNSIKLKESIKKLELKF